MLVRPRENQCAAIENGGIGPFDIEYFQGRSPAASSTLKGCHIDRGIEPQQRELRPRVCDAALRQIHRERQPDQSRADDEHVAPADVRHRQRWCAENVTEGMRYSSSAPEFFTMAAQRSTSASTYVAKLSGVDGGSGSSEIVVSFSRVAGSAISVPICAGSWSTMPRGARAGAPTPCHATSSKPGRPASARVGMLGAAATRFGVVTPRHLTLPSRIFCSAGCKSTTMN